MKTPYDILSEVVAGMREVIDYMNVTQLTPNRWQFNLVTPPEFSFVGDFVKILPENFEGKIIEINGSLLTVELSKNITSSTGTIQNFMPIFEYEMFDFEARKLAEKNKTIEKFKKFPLIFLDINFGQKISKKFTEINPTIYIINKTEEAWAMEVRNQRTFPKLRKIKDVFLTALKRHKNIYDIGDYTYKELPYRQNNLNAVVDTIQLQFNEIKLINCN